MHGRGNDQALGANDHRNGHFALILALGVALDADGTAGTGGARQRDARLMAVGEPAALAQLSLSLALPPSLALTHAYITSDFSVETVWANSHSAKPLIYKSPACGATTRAPCCCGC